MAESNRVPLWAVGLFMLLAVAITLLAVNLSQENSVTGNVIQENQNLEESNEGIQETTKVEPENTLSAEEKMANCITDKGIKLYTYEGEVFTQRILNSFGEGAKYLRIVNCGNDMSSAIDLCRTELGFTNTGGFPVWTKPSGEQLRGGEKEGSLERIKEFSGC